MGNLMDTHHSEPSLYPQTSFHSQQEQNPSAHLHTPQPTVHSFHPTEQIVSPIAIHNAPPPQTQYYHGAMPYQNHSQLHTTETNRFDQENMYEVQNVVTTGMPNSFPTAAPLSVSPVPLPQQDLVKYPFPR